MSTRIKAEIDTLIASDVNNNICADCQRGASTFANTTIGAFICETCSFYHKHTLNHSIKLIANSRHSWPKCIIKKILKVFPGPPKPTRTLQSCS
jgi:predicted amidophosphoribosyltransferase